MPQYPDARPPPRSATAAVSPGNFFPFPQSPGNFFPFHRCSTTTPAILRRASATAAVSRSFFPVRVSLSTAPAPCSFSMSAQTMTGKAAPPPEKGSPFFVVGPCDVKDSAVVVCLRHREQPPITLTQTEIGAVNGSLAKAASSFLNGTFGGKESMEFDCGWEVLCGQAVVVNYMRSTEEKISTMRYAGEYKLAGGNLDDGETVAEAAFRELSEEFGTVGQPIPSSAVLRPFVTKQTRPIRSRSNLMQNFVALAEENPWLAELDVEAVNADLAARRDYFEGVLASGAFWDMTDEEKEKVSPEVQRLDWLPLSEAIRHCLSSMVPGKDVIFVNEYQREEFAKHGQKRRDPMFITAAGLIELEGFPSIESLVAWCEDASLEDLTEQEQWIFQGMTNDDVNDAFNTRTTEGGGINSSMKTPDIIASLKQERKDAAAAATTSKL